MFKYLKAHLHTCAKFGYNQSKNMEEITNTLRRSLKGNETSELTVLLDFLMVLANSNKFVNSFDEKNKLFVE